MRAWVIDRYGDNSELKLRELPKPRPAADEVLVELKAASLNPVDFKMRSGELKLILHYDFPLVLGNDGAGVVSEVGASVTRFKPGDEVYLRPHKEAIGTLAEWISAKEDSVALKPRNVDFVQAASLPLVGLTCWQALSPHLKPGTQLNPGSQLKPGARVFIPAGSGGVGTFAIQLAKALGAYVITNTSTRNLQFVRALGADEVLDYTRVDFAQVLAPVDLVFDTMGGDTQKKAFTILKPGGRLISIVGPPTAAFARQAGTSWPLQLGAGFLGLPSTWRAWRSNAKYEFLFMTPSGRELEEIAARVESGQIRPVIDQVFPFREAPEAMAKLETGRARGKIVVQI